MTDTLSRIFVHLFGKFITRGRQTNCFPVPVPYKKMRRAHMSLGTKKNLYTVDFPYERKFVTIISNSAID